MERRRRFGHSSWARLPTCLLTIKAQIVDSIGQIYAWGEEKKSCKMESRLLICVWHCFVLGRAGACIENFVSGMWRQSVCIYVRQRNT